MEFRRLVGADYENFMALYMELAELHVQARPDCFVHQEPEKTYPKDAFLQNIALPGGFELGAFENGQIVGFVEATVWEESEMVKDVKTVCLDNIYVLPAYRRRGIGAKLFAEAEAWAKAQGAIRLDLHTWDFNKSAIAMYRAMGMTPQKYVFEKKL